MPVGIGAKVLVSVPKQPLKMGMLLSMRLHRTVPLRRASV